MAYRKAYSNPEFRLLAEQNELKPVNLAEVRAIIEADKQLSPTARRDIRSALQTLARVSSRSLAEIPAETKTVREFLDGVAPALHDISLGRWRNIRSLVFKSLAVAGVNRLAGRSNEPPSTSWQALLDQLPYRPYQVGLMTLARYCTGQGIEPEKLNQETCERFSRALEEFSIRTNPRSAYVEACRAWNKAAALVAAWPAFRVQLDDRRKRYSLPWSTYPATLKDDIDAMIEDALSPDLTAPTSRKPVKKVTTQARLSLLGPLLAAQIEGGVPPESLRSIVDVLAVDNVRTGLRLLLKRAGEIPTAYIHQHAKLICTLAKHWAKVPDEQLAQLIAIRNNLNPGRHGMTAKNRKTLRYFENEKLVEKLLNLPANVARRYKDRAPSNRTAAVQLQSSLAVELLIIAPVRCKNLVSTRIGLNIIDTGSGRTRRVHLYYPPVDVKNDVELEFPLPESTVKLLDFYIQEVRPHLLRAPSDYLFPGEGKGPKGGALLSEQIATLVETEIGVRLTAHQFRHIAGFMYLQQNPGGHEVVRQLLGHKSIDTTIRFYAGMEVKKAIKHYDDLIEKRRSKLTKTHLRRRRTNRQK